MRYQRGSRFSGTQWPERGMETGEEQIGSLQSKQKVTVGNANFMQGRQTAGQRMFFLLHTLQLGHCSKVVFILIFAYLDRNQPPTLAAATRQVCCKHATNWLEASTIALHCPLGMVFPG